VLNVMERSIKFGVNFGKNSLVLKALYLESYVTLNSAITAFRDQIGRIDVLFQLCWVCAMRGTF